MQFQVYGNVAMRRPQKKSFLKNEQIKYVTRLHFLKNE